MRDYKPALAQTESSGEAPPVPVRTMAEWEELQALVITWQGQQAILTEIVRNAREECNVIVCCNNQNTVTTAQNYLSGQGVDLSSNVTFLVAPSNSIWVRDYGPNCVYGNDVDSLYIIDWIYNRPRPLDDALPVPIANYLNVPIFRTNTLPTDMVHTGGNFMSDGMGMGFSSKLVLDENGPNNQYGLSNHSEAEVDAIMYDFMGIHTYPKMNPLPYDVIHHIDMHMKLLDEQTLLVGQYPQGIADGPQIEANIQYVLSNYTTSFGTPFKVIRIPMPPEGTSYPNNGGDYRTYANAVFVNKTVLVPFYEQKYDTTAQRIWEQSLPGYKIVGINCNSIIPSLGAIHCITKEIGVADPLRIVHRPLEDIDQAIGTLGYPVHATIQHRSGISNAKVWYTTDPLNGTWQSVDMTPWSPLDTANVWMGNLPAQFAGTDVYYYIEANAVSGKNGLRPLPAPDGWWKFHVSGNFSSSQFPPFIHLGNVFPNPASAITVIPVDAPVRTVGTISLVNMYGQTVRTIHSGIIPKGQSNYFLQAGDFPQGIYSVRMSDGVQVREQKLVILR